MIKDNPPDASARNKSEISESASQTANLHELPKETEGKMDRQ